jgi:hypothetical protein
VDPLTNELAAVRAELPRVDAKCGTLTGLTMAGIAFLATQVTHGPTAVRVLMAASGLTMAAATVVLLAVVIRPRFGSTGFRAYATATPAELRTLLIAECQATQERDLIVLSRITNRKYRGLKLATDLTVVAVALAAVAIVAGVLS